MEMKARLPVGQSCSQGQSASLGPPFQPECMRDTFLSQNNLHLAWNHHSVAEMLPLHIQESWPGLNKCTSAWPTEIDVCQKGGWDGYFWKLLVW